MPSNTELAIIANDLKHHSAALGRAQVKISELDDRIRDLEEMEHEFMDFKDTVYDKFRGVADELHTTKAEADDSKEEIKAAKLWIKVIKSIGGIALISMFYLVSNIADVNNFIDGVKTMVHSGDVNGN